jgi:hypothetical protein
MSDLRRFIGAVLLVAGPVVVLYAYGGLPSASTCEVSSTVQRQVGGQQWCPTHPAVGYWIAAALLALAGLAFWSPRLLRWQAGKGRQS